MAAYYFSNGAAGYYSGETTASVSTTAAWAGWVTDYYASASTCSISTCSTSTVVWTNWIINSDSSAAIITHSVEDLQGQTPNIQVTPRRETPEERETRVNRERAAAAEREKQRKEFAEKKRIAEETAIVLLQELIGEKQAAMYRKTGRILIKKDGYVLLLAKGQMIRKIKDGKVTTLCVHVVDPHSMPETDNIIAQLLWAWADDYHLEKTANNHGTRDFTEKIPEAAVA